jgi:hypothetical protein
MCFNLREQQEILDEAALPVRPGNNPCGSCLELGGIPMPDFCP